MIRFLPALAFALSAGAAAAEDAWIALVAGEERLEIAPGDIRDAELIEDYRGEPALAIRLTPAAAKAFADLTARIIGQPLEVRHGNEVLMAPYVREPIIGGSFQVSGPEEAELKALLDALEPK